MENSPKKPITEVFAKLLARLSELSLYHATVNYDALPEVNYKLIDEIGSQIFEYSTSEALKFIDFALTKIQHLQAEEEEIVAAVNVDIEHDIYGTMLANEVQTETAKKQLYEDIRVQLMYFSRKLSIIKESLLLNLSLKTPSKKEVEKIVIIPTDELLLDMRQSALLFYYLKEAKVIQPHVNDKLSIYISLLTGFSEQKLRTTKGLGSIPNIMSDKNVVIKKKKDTPHFNLNSVKNALQKIIKDVEFEIAERSKKK
jgi:hypothetical protein